MKCPVCTETDLVMTERKGVEIDYCPKCRGVWLDRGELDKIIERGAAEAQPGASVPRGTPEPIRRDDPRHEEKYYGRKRRESWLSELFD